MIRSAVFAIAVLFGPPLDVEAEPVEISIDAPVDAVVGDLVKIHASVKGEPLRYKWTLAPDDTGLEVIDGGTKAVFSNRNPGLYIIFVSVSGADGSVDHDVREIILRSPAPPPNFQPAQLPQQHEPQAEPQVQHEQEVDPIALLHAWYQDVNSATRAGDAKQIAGTVLQAANAFSAGTLQGHPLLAAEALAEAALTERGFEPWRPFFDNTELLCGQLEEAGILNSRANYETFLKNLAAVLDTAADE